MKKQDTTIPILIFLAGLIWVAVFAFLLNIKTIMKKKISELDKKRSLAIKAMVEVKRLVKKYNRTTINYCLNQLRDYDKKLAKLEKAKKEVEEIQKELK